MGEVKDTVKGNALGREGPGLPKGKLAKKLKKLMGKDEFSGTNLIQVTAAIQEKVSELIQIKDNDAITEGKAAKPENERKAATLRAVHSLYTTAKNLLEDY